MQITEKLQHKILHSSKGRMVRKKPHRVVKLRHNGTLLLCCDDYLCVYALFSFKSNSQTLLISIVKYQNIAVSGGTFVILLKFSDI